VVGVDGDEPPTMAIGLLLAATTLRMGGDSILDDWIEEPLFTDFGCEPLLMDDFSTPVLLLPGGVGGG